MPHLTDPGTPAPPVAPRFLPGGPQAVLPGGDPYAWMRDRDLPAMRDYLAAERAYYDEQLDAGLREESASRDTTETLIIPAAGTSAAAAVLEPRKAGVEYRADHADGPDGGSSTWLPPTRQRSSGWCGLPQR